MSQLASRGAQTGGRADVDRVLEQWQVSADESLARTQTDTSGRPRAVTAGTEPFDKRVGFAGQTGARRARACPLFPSPSVSRNEGVPGSNPRGPRFESGRRLLENPRQSGGSRRCDGLNRTKNRISLSRSVASSTRLAPRRARSSSTISSRSRSKRPRGRVSPRHYLADGDRATPAARRNRGWAG
jgi:hypothetical protein